MTMDTDRLIESDETLRRARVGIEAAQFKRTPLGRYILQRANEQIHAARELMDDVDPNDSERIAFLQKQIQVAKSIETWLDEAIHEGMIAEQAILEEDSYESAE